MFDFEALTEREVLGRDDTLTSKQEVESEACSAEELRAKKAGELRRNVLRRAVKEKCSQREPSFVTLRKWEDCDAVQDLVRHFLLEGSLGVSEYIKVSEALRLLEALNWTADKLLDCFLPKDEELPGESRDLGLDLLRVFAGLERPGDELMSFRSLFRLLEVLNCGIADFLEELGDVKFEEEPEPPNVVTIGSYSMTKGIGSGFNGVCIYRGQHVNTGHQVAIKWPIRKEELEVLKDIGRQNPPRFLNLPEVLAHGTYAGKSYAVTELLGSPLTKVLGRLRGKPTELCWRCMKIVGRLVLRRLEALHGCGFVHCDVSPENVLLGAPRRTGGKRGAPVARVLTPYLIDFGLAQKFPGGRALDADQGSAEWNSVRSACGAVRRPEDDLEALGWLLINGLVGELPWFQVLSTAYKSWDESMAVRAKAVRKVQEAKLQLLNEGWGSLGGEWSKLGRVPPPLDRYMQTCRSDRATHQRPDYAHLSELLGGKLGLDMQAADEADVEQFQEILAKLE